MTKITLIGAGSTVFTRNLLGDILSFPELAASTFALHDIDAERLRASEIVANKVAKALNAHPTIESTTDRRAALAGANYVICMIQVAGYKPGTVIDFEIPKKYGLRQTIADTLGIYAPFRSYYQYVRIWLNFVLKPYYLTTSTPWRLIVGRYLELLAYRQSACATVCPLP